MKKTSDDIYQFIEQLDSLPTSMSVAIRLIELSMNPDAEIEDYVRLIRLDPALSAKLIAVSNSSWCGVARKVTQVRQAINLLGAANVRVLAVSYCVGGIHRAWELAIENAQAYWESSLCKATGARLLARDPAVNGEELFTLSLLQDIGLGLLVSFGGQEAALRMLDPTCDIAAQLAWEVEEFGVDHAQCGGLVAEKLGLPEPFRSAVRLHHRPLELEMHVHEADAAATLQIAACLPHDLRSWKPSDLQRLATLLEMRNGANGPNATTFLDNVRREHQALVTALGHHATAWPATLELAQSCAISVQ
jgi:HD-like signal output (HDOD) protein